MWLTRLPLSQGVDLFGRDEPLLYVAPDDLDLPPYVANNMHLYPHFLPFVSPQDMGGLKQRLAARAAANATSAANARDGPMQGEGESGA